MKEDFTLTTPDFDICLRTITSADCENLRQWKNANRFAFFFQGIITAEQQAAWFDAYQTRPDDSMFMVLVDASPIGCMGFRLIDNYADVYNVIVGKRSSAGKGLMRQAMRLMCSYVAADFSRDIRAQVLLDNPATEWYRKNFFREHARHERFTVFTLNLDLFRPCQFVKASS